VPRRIGLPSLYLAAAVATAMTTAVPLAMTPASGLASRPPVTELTRPYIVTARDRAAARDLVGEVRWRVRRFYTTALPGFATWLSARELAELRTDARVIAIEPDRRVRQLPFASTSPFRTPGSGPFRAQGSGPFRAQGSGKGVTAYVVDSGIDPDSGEFGDRAWRAFDATGGTGEDCGGHGTRVARAVAGRSYGMAPQARVASVRVLDCGGSGSLSDVLAGLDWVHRHARRPAVANLSFDGADSPALRTTMGRLTQSGVFVVASASNGGCRLSPTGETYSSGAPYLAGAAASYLELHPGANPSVLGSWLKCTATGETIRQNPSRALR
jgi:hypothetical protein